MFTPFVMNIPVASAADQRRRCGHWDRVLPDIKATHTPRPTSPDNHSLLLTLLTKGLSVVSMG